MYVCGQVSGVRKRLVSRGQVRFSEILRIRFLGSAVAPNSSRRMLSHSRDDEPFILAQRAAFEWTQDELPLTG